MAISHPPTYNNWLFNKYMGSYIVHINCSGLEPLYFVSLVCFCDIFIFQKNNLGFLGLSSIPYFGVRQFSYFDTFCEFALVHHLWV